MCHRRRSYLGHVDYDGLRLFQWAGVIEEMVLNQTRLLDVLTAVATNRHEHSDSFFFDISREIGMVYGILMKRRSHFLTRIQRVVSMALSDESVHQKVWFIISPLPACHRDS